MKICMISSLPPPIGGISRWTEMILEKSSSDSDVEIDVLDISSKGRPIGSNILLRITLGGLQLIKDIIKFISKIIKKPDLVHINSSGSLSIVRDIILIIISTIFKVQIVYHVHHGQFDQKINIFARVFLIVLSKIARRIIAINSKTYCNIKSLNINNVDKVPNFISMSVVNNLQRKEKQKIIVYVGWIIKTKGVEELIKSFTKIDNSEWKLLIIGPQDELFVKYLKNNYKLKNIRISKPIRHECVLRLLSSSSVFVLPSYTEGFPNVILEAMLCKSAIISTNVGAIPEIITDKCGVLVNPKDVEGLTIAIKNMIKEEDIRSKYTENAYFRLINNYTLDIVYNKYKAVWVNK